MCCGGDQFCYGTLIINFYFGIENLVSLNADRNIISKGGNVKYLI